MGKAVVVFADGSKQMAHNLNDLSYRWHERKTESAAEVLGQRFVIRDCSQPKDREQATRWRHELMLQRSRLLEMREGFRGDKRAEDYLNFARMEVERQLSLLKSYMRTHASENDASLRQMIAELQAQVESLEARVVYLEQQPSAGEDSGHLR